LKLFLGLFTNESLFIIIFACFSLERKLPLEASCDELLTDWLQIQENNPNVTAPHIVIVSRLNELGFKDIADRVSFADIQNKIDEAVNGTETGSGDDYLIATNGTTEQ